MKIIDKYLIRRFMTPFLYCIFAFLILYITYDASINLDEFLKNKIGLHILLRYYFIKCPMIIVTSTPLAILLALLYDIGNMNRHHEIIAMRASGIHIDRIILPFLVVAVTCAVIIFFINDQFVCKYAFEESVLKKQIFEGEKTVQYELWKNMPFRNPSANRDWFIESFNLETKELSGVIVREFGDDGEINQKVIAKKAKWIDGQWLFLDGSIYFYNKEGLPQLSDEGQYREPKKFSKMLMTYNVTPEDFENTRKHLATMNFMSLLRYLMLQNKNSRLYRSTLVDLHNKIAFPFVCIIAVLVGIPFAIKTQRGGFIKGIGISMILFLAYYGISIISTMMGKNGFFTPFVAVWIPNVIFMIFGIFLIKNAA
ncbi:LptF/LptG family permease [bacterium]|nr:LptF/LptG family permease [bacterium]